MRSYALAALALFAASTANAGHGEHKGRYHARAAECNLTPPQVTVTSSYTLYPGRKHVATGRSSSVQPSSTMVTSSKTTSTIVQSTKVVTSNTSSKPVSISRVPSKPAVTSSKSTTISTTTSKPVATTTTKASTTSKPLTNSKPVTSSKPATTSKAATTSASSSKPPAATNTGGSGNGLFASEILKAHNAARLPRNAKALTWSSEAEALAKTWAEKCIWQHGGNPNMGQNLAASAGFKQTGPEVVGAWMSEEKDYNPASPSYSHFTQVVWKSTTAVGCYQATCSKMLMPDGSEVFPNYSPTYMTVCNYSPPGNYVGSAPQNVEKLSK